MCKMYLKMLLAVLLVSTPIPTFSQVVPDATEGKWPLTVGVGYSNYHTDWSGRLGGPMFWADWNFYKAPLLLHGIGIEVEGRDLNYGLTGGDPKLRMDTLSGGAIYTWRQYRRFHPLAKFLVGYGSIDFTSSDPNYSHDTRAYYAPGGGLDYRVLGSVWVRGNYEYQFWPDFINHHTLNPNGLTIGVAYDFRGSDREILRIKPNE